MDNLAFEMRQVYVITLKLVYIEVKNVTAMSSYSIHACTRKSRGQVSIHFCKFYVHFCVQ